MIGRVFRIVRTPITLLLLLGVLCYAAWWGYTNVLRPIPPAPPSPCVDQSVTKGSLESSQVTVRVFNGGNKRGLAGDVGRALRDRGFNVTRTANTGEKIQKTVIVGAELTDPEVMLVKAFFKDVIVKADHRVDHTVDVLVGNKYGGFNKNAKTRLAVTSPTVCLPSQTRSATPALGG